MPEQTAEQALEQGYVGTVYDPIENDAYTLQGQGPETAQREREARDTLRKAFQDASVEQPTPKTRATSKRSSSSSEGSSS
jgi:hypothetical protein